MHVYVETYITQKRERERERDKARATIPFAYHIVRLILYEYIELVNTRSNSWLRFQKNKKEKERDAIILFAYRAGRTFCFL